MTISHFLMNAAYFLIILTAKSDAFSITAASLASLFHIVRPPTMYHARRKNAYRLHWRKASEPRSRVTTVFVAEEGLFSPYFFTMTFREIYAVFASAAFPAVIDAARRRATALSLTADAASKRAHSRLPCLSFLDFAGISIRPGAAKFIYRFSITRRIGVLLIALRAPMAGDIAEL